MQNLGVEIDMESTEVESIYCQRRQIYLEPIEKHLEAHLRDTIGTYPRIDRISVRSKSVDKFVSKAKKVAADNVLKYSDPINQIQDQLGARVVTNYIEDVDCISKIIKNYYRYVEEQHFIPDSASEFGYEGRHFILFIPDDIIFSEEQKHNLPPFFELQIKTLFQHAWGEAEHDLGYKPSAPLDFEQQRKISFTAAQAWGADMIFNELFVSKQKSRNATVS